MTEGEAALSDEDAPFQPTPRPKAITLRLAMEKSLTPNELVEYNRLSPEGALEKAKSLKSVHLQWQNIHEINGLDPFESAEVLYLQYNQIQRIEGLECLPHLQFLALQHNRITIVENLMCLPLLEFLDLRMNRITILHENNLPQSINMLNIKDNPCTELPDFRERLLERLPELALLDGEEIEQSAKDSSLLKGEMANPVEGEDVQDSGLEGGEKGLAAYWLKGQMRDGVSKSIADLISAYTMESLADVEGFSKQVDGVTERSKTRRKDLEGHQQLESIIRAAQSSLHTQQQGLK